MSKAIRVLVLALALSVSAYAGDMQFGYTNPPPPLPLSTSVTQDETPTDGVINTGAADDQNHTAAAESLTETVLNIVGSVLSLF